MSARARLAALAFVAAASAAGCLFPSYTADGVPGEPGASGGSSSAGGTNGGGGSTSAGGCSCSFPNATSTCDASGACSFGACNQGFLDCDGDTSDGCEVDGANDPAHCGACDVVCSAGTNQKAGCLAGTCKATCAPGFADCNANEGCETAISADLMNCGSCGHVCSLPNATPTCDGGTCRIVSCNALFGDCDQDPSNGCERSLDTKLDCGACSMKCIGNKQCVNGACQ